MLMHWCKGSYNSPFHLKNETKQTNKKLHDNIRKYTVLERRSILLSSKLSDMFQELSVHQIAFQSILEGGKKERKKEKRQISVGLFTFFDSCCSCEVRMVMQLRCWNGLPKCYGQILLLQTLGTLPSWHQVHGMSHFTALCGYICTMPQTGEMEILQWLQESPAAALVEMSRNPLGFCWGQRQTKNWPLHFLAWLPTPRICKWELNPSQHKCKKQNSPPPCTAASMREKPFWKERGEAPHGIITSHEHTPAIISRGFWEGAAAALRTESSLRKDRCQIIILGFKIENTLWA